MSDAELDVDNGADVIGPDVVLLLDGVDLDELPAVAFAAVVDGRVGAGVNDGFINVGMVDGHAQVDRSVVVVPVTSHAVDVCEQLVLGQVVYRESVDEVV